MNQTAPLAAALDFAFRALTIDTVEVGSDVYRAGYTDDGVEFVAESYRVTVTNAFGDRLVHRTTFSGAVAHDLEDGFGQSFEDVRPQALAQATRLADRVRAALAAGQALNPALWQQDRPVYGSDAYVAYGQDEDNAWEDRCNQDEALGLR